MLFSLSAFPFEFVAREEGNEETDNVGTGIQCAGELRLGCRFEEVGIGG